MVEIKKMPPSHQNNTKFHQNPNEKTFGTFLVSLCFGGEKIFYQINGLILKPDKIDI